MKNDDNTDDNTDDDTDDNNTDDDTDDDNTDDDTDDDTGWICFTYFHLSHMRMSLRFAHFQLSYI